MLTRQAVVLFTHLLAALGVIQHLYCFLDSVLRDVVIKFNDIESLGADINRENSVIIDHDGALKIERF